MSINPSLRENYLAALRECQGAVGKACDATGIWYNDLVRYRRQDPEFDALVRSTVEEFDDKLLDMAINNMTKAVMEGDLEMTRFVIKMRGRGRGYGSNDAPLANIQVNGSTINIEAVGGDDE